MPGVSGELAVNTRVHSNHHFRTRGCGCTGHPAFPTPSLGGTTGIPRAKQAAGSRSRIQRPDRILPTGMSRTRQIRRVETSVAALTIACTTDRFAGPAQSGPASPGKGRNPVFYDAKSRWRGGPADFAVNRSNPWRFQPKWPKARPTHLIPSGHAAAHLRPVRFEAPSVFPR